jgi:hypothetical protein
VFFSTNGLRNQMTSTLSSDLRGAIARVRWRLRAQRTAEHVVRVTAASGALVALVTILDRLYLLPVGTLNWALLVFCVTTVTAALWGYRHAPTELEAAQRLDTHLQTRDRLAAAVDFSARAETTAWMRAAIADAERHLDRVRVQDAAPFSLPVHGRRAAWALVAWLVSTVVLFPIAEVEARGLAQLNVPKRFELAVVALDEQAQEELFAEESSTAPDPGVDLDPLVEKAIQDLNDLIRGLRSDEVRLETAHQRLASLEARLARFAKENGEDAPKELERAKRAAKSRKKRGREINPLLEAIREAKWREAAEALESLIKRGPKSKRRLGRDLEKLAKRLESQRAREKRSLQKERRRLQKKRESEGRLGRRDRRRLRKNQRSLERLERESARAGETGRQLKRLERELQQAAEDLLRRSHSPAVSGEALKRAADLLRRLQKGENSRAQMRRVAARAEAIRELLRRAAQRAKSGKDGKKGDGRTRFMRLARGEGSSKSGRAGESGKKKGGSALVLTSSKTSKVAVMRQSASGGPAQSDRDRQGDSSTGHGHDPDFLGEKERIAVRTQDVSVAGEEGEGPSSSQVVAAAAQRGFATRGWRKVHQDYRGVVEERMERQSIPAGHRRYVRRYFDLIRPR